MSITPRSAALAAMLIPFSLPGCAAKPSASAKPSPSATASSALAVPVAVIHPRRGTLRATLNLPGHMQPEWSTRLGAQVAGRLATLSVDVGDSFKAGQTLATEADPRLDARLNVAHSRVARAHAAVRAARAALRLAGLHRTRLAKVASGGRGLVAPERIDEAVAGVALASSSLAKQRAEVREAEAKVALIETRIGLLRLHAPFSGVVTGRLADPGTMLLPGDPVLAIARVDRVRAVAYLPGDRANGMKVGAAVRLSFPGTSVPAIQTHVARLGGAIDPTSQSLLVEADLARPAGVPAGAYMRFHLRLAPRKNALILPVAAFQVPARPGHVFVLSGGRCRLRRVHQGVEVGGRVEILAGVSPHDQVVIRAGGSVTDGTPCRGGM